MLGAVIAHPSDGHDAQLHVHCAPEAVSKLTASTAPAAAVDACTALPTARKPASVRTADCRRGGGRRASRRGCRRYGRRRRSCTSAAGVTASRRGGRVPFWVVPSLKLLSEKKTPPASRSWSDSTVPVGRIVLQRCGGSLHGRCTPNRATVPRGAHVSTRVAFE
jgi:hypothetical protein